MCVCPRTYVYVCAQTYSAVINCLPFTAMCLHVVSDASETNGRENSTVQVYSSTTTDACKQH